MDKQKTYEKVRKHLDAQGRKAMGTNKDGEEMCVYRAADGSRCGIGALIPNRLYRKGMEGEGITTVMAKYPLIAKHLDVAPHDFDNGNKARYNDEDFLACVQSAHDSYDSMHRILDALDAVAVMNGLVVVH